MLTHFILDKLINLLLNNRLEAGHYSDLNFTLNHGSHLVFCHFFKELLYNNNGLGFDLNLDLIDDFLSLVFQPKLILRPEIGKLSAQDVYS